MMCQLLHRGIERKGQEIIRCLTDMSAPLRLLSLTDQAAQHLRDGIRSGRWKDHLPGVHKLAAELGVSRNTIARAVARLVAEGALAGTGARKAHAIVSAGTPPAVGPRTLRIALLRVVPAEKSDSIAQTLLLNIIMQVKAAGHTCMFVTLPLGKDTHKTGYLPRLLKETEADVWMIYMGTLEILEWFIARGEPVFALAGRCRGLPIAAVASDGISLMRESVRRLVALKHRRIVLLSSQDSRRPTPSRLLQAFLEELEAAGVQPGEYHTPDWEETPDGVIKLLESLFQVTPPTALICTSLNTTAGTLAFLTRRGLDIPRDVSVLSLEDADPLLEWIFPGVQVAHPRVPYEPFYRRIREWVANVAVGGTPDTRQFWYTLKLDQGTTIGPAKRS